jgi:hypothetical protein
VSVPYPENYSRLFCFEGIEEIVGSVLTFKPLLLCDLKKRRFFSRIEG